MDVKQEAVKVAGSETEEHSTVIGVSEKNDTVRRKVVSGELCSVGGK